MTVRTKMGVDKQIIRKVYLRDRGICGQCGTDMTLIQHLYNLLCSAGVPDSDLVLNYWRVSPARDFGRWWTIDHIRPLSAGGDSSMVNLQTLCGPCHAEKEQTDRTAQTWTVDGDEDCPVVAEAVSG